MSFSKTVWPLFKRYLQTSKRPILVGPFRGEVGFEALYWLPFLHALELDPARMHVVTRGGAGLWYGGWRHPQVTAQTVGPQPTWHPAASVTDLYSLRSERDVRVENTLQFKLTGMMKQRRVNDFDRKVIADVIKERGLKRPIVLHPSWMYQLTEDFWNNRVGLVGLQQPLTFAPLPVPELPPNVKLPENFVAVRFYYRHTFPFGDVATTVARETIKTIAASQPVVILNSGIHADEHVDFVPKGLKNVHFLHDLCQMTPQNNLAVISGALARAQGFVGTYGGLSQLALRYGRPSYSFYVDWSGTASAHKQLSDTLALHMGVPFTVLRVTEIPLLHAILPKLEFSTKKASTTVKDLAPTG